MWGMVDVFQFCNQVSELIKSLSQNRGLRGEENPDVRQQFWW